MTSTGQALLSPGESAERGRTARAATPRSAHGDWAPATDRPDPIDVLQAQATSRIQSLVPIRYGRMLVSAFTFYRGAAAIMATDLAHTPTSGIAVQACGDAHISNFGGFAAPDRQLVFGPNDFDETLPGPWEWDVKRMAASVEIAGRDVELPADRRQRLVEACAREYREAMGTFAAESHLDVWYDRLDASELIDRFGDELRFRHLPPLLVPLREMLDDSLIADEQDYVRELMGQYAAGLDEDRKYLFSNYRFVDMARKVVGVGSVGTRAWVLLFTGRDGQDPLVLQAKEAQESVLEPFVGASRFDNHGERVVHGQRISQAVTDIFLNWQRSTGPDGHDYDFYVRQLWDWKASIDLATLTESGLHAYSRACGWSMARTHARSGDRLAMAAYLGSSRSFDRAIARFSSAYADQNELDHQSLADAVAAGEVRAQFGLRAREHDCRQRAPQSVGDSSYPPGRVDLAELADEVLSQGSRSLG